MQFLRSTGVCDGARREMCVYAVREGKCCRDLVARHRSDRLSGLPDVRRLQFPAVGGDVRHHPLRIPEEDTHHVEQVSPEHHQIFPARTTVFLASRTNLLNPADLTPIDHRFGTQSIW